MDHSACPRWQLRRRRCGVPQITDAAAVVKLDSDGDDVTLALVSLRRLGRVSR